MFILVILYRDIKKVIRIGLCQSAIQNLSAVRPCCSSIIFFLKLEQHNHGLAHNFTLKFFLLLVHNFTTKFSQRTTTLHQICHGNHSSLHSKKLLQSLTILHQKTHDNCSSLSSKFLDCSLIIFFEIFIEIALNFTPKISCYSAIISSKFSLTFVYNFQATHS